MRLLVTGGAGFIGSNFIRYWLRVHQGDAIANVDALTYAGDLATIEDVAHAEKDRYAFSKGDINDAGFVADLIEEHRPDVIVNFAAESHNSRAILDPALFL